MTTASRRYVGVRQSSGNERRMIRGFRIANKDRAFVSAETWHEERDRLVRLLDAIETGKITHIDEEEERQLQATTPENIAVLRKRLADLNARLGR